ncbi:dipeptidase [Streptomyces sp. NPDC101118]|uniref:dipeptidase n=1 Tax=Streptomyces sp. NPDC101118 TaxID=3366109 RepID=UPI003811A2C8
MADLQDETHEGPGAAGAVEPPPGGPEPAAQPAPEPAAGPEPSRPVPERVAALLAAHPVVDGCNDLLWTLRQSPLHDLATVESTVDTDLPRLRAGGVGGLFWSLLVPGETADGTGAPVPDDRVVAGTLEQIDFARQMFRRYPDSLCTAFGPDELADARNRGRIASFMGPVSGRALDASLGPLRAFHALGVRSLAPAGAAWAERGLSAFGHEVVREMNRLAMVLDLAGCGPETARTLIAASKAPVLVSHAGAAALHPHPGNVPDDVLEALGAAKGLCMVTCAADRLAPAGVPVTPATVADHLDHVRTVAGPHAVGLGGAFGTGPAAPRPEGLTDPSGYPRLIAELLDRDWPEPDIALLTWGNAQRVLRDAEFTARAAQYRRSA